MSEIQDAAQIIRVSIEGTELILKLGKANWDFVKGVCAVFKKMLDQEKLAGKTSVKQLLKSGGDLQVFQFQTKDLDTVKKLADKYGILYSILPDLNAADGMSGILFHSQAAPRIQSIMEQIQHSRIEGMDDYFTNAEPEELEQVVREAEKKSAVSKENEYRTHAGKHRGTGQEPSGEKLEEIRRIQKQYRENPKANGITIDRKMVTEETERSIKTRIPYKRDEYIWLRKSEITWINGNKTIYANLEKEKTYQVLDSENRPVRRVSGKDLYEQSYTPVNPDRMKLEQDRRKKQKQKEKQYQRNQKALEDVKKAVQGRERR